MPEKNLKQDPDWQAPKVAICMPTGGEVVTATVRCLIALTQRFQSENIPFAFFHYEFSDIVMSRNQLASKFLAHKEFTHMLMIDADMEFEVEAVMRMLKFDAPFTACAYPQKRYDFNALFEEAAREKDGDTPIDALAVLSRNARFNHVFRDPDKNQHVPVFKGGFVSVPATGTGLMCVHRLVFEEMLEAGAAEHLPEMEKFPLHKGLKFCDFFTHIIRHGVIHGEDASFCYRWVNLCGGEIWLDASQIVSHWGSRAHTARYMEQLLSQYPALARQLKEMAEDKENQ